MTTSVLENLLCPRRINSVDENIGGTPLIKLQRLASDPLRNLEIFLKAEHLNPGGSVKDRPALRMIVDGEDRGLLRKGMTILDASSGNTGIAYAMIGAARGYKVKICLPRNASNERKRILTSYGVEIVETDPLLSTDGAQQCARQIFEQDRDTYFYPDQYNNPANWLAHYETTGPEIWEQTGGKITHFVAGLGTSGTFMGTVRKLKELNPQLIAVSMQPDSPLHGLEGLKHMQTATVPGIYDPNLADLEMEVSTDEGRTMANRLAREEGLLVGSSSGANVFAAVKLASTVPAGSVIVTVLCDRAERSFA